MHEYSVVAEILNSLEPQLVEHPGRVTAIYLKKGELRILSDHALYNAFEVLIKDTRFEASRLVVETIPASIRCLACGHEGAPETVADDAYHFAVPVLTCPKCDAEVEMVAGRELYVDRVSIETEADDTPSSGATDA